MFYAALQRLLLRRRKTVDIAAVQRYVGIVQRKSAYNSKGSIMAVNTDLNAVFKDMVEAFPVDMTAMEGAFKNTATLNEKLSSVALEAVEKSQEIAANWAKETVSKMGDLAKAKEQPADYAKAMTDFASAQADGASEYMSAFADVANKMQMATIELLLNAGKDMGKEAQDAVKDVTTKATAAAKKATAATAK